MKLTGRGFIVTYDKNGNDVILHLDSPHLTREQARELARLLLEFASSSDEEQQQEGGE